jgi:hypothetical protein
VNPFDDQDLFAVLQVGDRTSPGVVTLTNHDRGKNWDVKTVKGQDGSTSSYVGSPVGQFKASFKLVKDYETGEDQFELWDEFQAYLETLIDGTTPKAVAIYHPDLARQHITDVTLKGITGMTYDEKGCGYVSVDFIEYKPPKKKKQTKTAAAPPKQAKASPKNAREAEVAALTAEWQSP